MRENWPPKGADAALAYQPSATLESGIGTSDVTMPVPVKRTVANVSAREVDKPTTRSAKPVALRTNVRFRIVGAERPILIERLSAVPGAVTCNSIVPATDPV